MLFKTSPVVFLVSLLIKDVCCDYSCLCSYQVELEIFDKPDPSSNVDGYMYEFDCKPAYNVDGLDSTYRAIGNEGKIGYVQYSSNIQLQTCQGSIPDIDRVKTTMGVTSTTTQATTTTTLPTTTTTLPKVTTPTVSSTMMMTSTKVTTPPTTTTTVLLTTIKTTMKPTTTKVTTPPSTTTTPITTRITTKPSPSNTCPAVVNQRTSPQKLFQNGNICYEFVTLTKTWLEAQNYCNTSGGHLVSIENQAQQTFVSNILSQLSVNDPVWLGLNDRLNEEHWVLDTGVLAVYTNWEPGRFIQQYHNVENCGLMIPVHKYRWDDVNCNGMTYAGYKGHPWICQYM